MVKYGECLGCTKIVGMAKGRRISSVGLWHSECFVCTRCNRTLSLGSFCESNAMPYCETCYNKKFGPKGVVAGVMSNTESMDRVSASDIDVRETKPVLEMIILFESMAR